MSKRKIKCEFCGKEFFICNIEQHKVRHYNGNYEKSLNVKHLSHEGLNCMYCNKLCKNRKSLAQHEIRCSDNPNRIKVGSGIKGKCNIPLEKRGWSKGLTKENDERLMNLSKALNERNSKVKYIGHPHTLETKELLRQKAIEGAFQNHFGSRKIYYYDNVKFYSSYEVIVATDLDNNNIRWIQPKTNLFKYKDLNGKIHSYTPDFYLPDFNVYLDPKNDYLINNVNPVLKFKDVDKIKWVCEQNNVKIIVLDKNHLTWKDIEELIQNCALK